MSAGADAHVVAERPIIEIVPAARALARVRGHFVLHEAGRGEQFLPVALDLPGCILVRQRRRARMKYRAGLEGQLIVGDVRGVQRAGNAHVVERFLERLFRQRVHQIEVEIIEPRGAQFVDRALRILGRVNAAQPLERARREALRAERDAVDARRSA